MTWQGQPELLVHSPAIYLDWAVNKENRGDALTFLADVRDFIDEGPMDRFATPDNALQAWKHSAEPVVAIGAVTIAYTDKWRCKTAFRPRRAILSYLHPTFWALWNELVRFASDDPGGIETNVTNLGRQLDYYDAQGIGMRGGVAPSFAAMGGAGERLSEEVAAFHGLTLAEFRALPEAERHRLTDEHTDHELGFSSDE